MPHQDSSQPTKSKMEDPQILSLVLGGALALDNGTNALVNIASLVVGDANADTEARDKTPAYYTSTLSVNDAKRNESQEFIVSIHDAVNENGSEKYPLDVRMNCFVTKLEINDSANPPRAIGVGLLDGKYFTELKKHGIKVPVDLPGVGKNRQDQYEAMVQVHTPKDISSLKACPFRLHGQSDPCLTRWMKSVLGDRGIYSSSGVLTSMFYKSTATTSDEIDINLFSVFTCTALEAYPRNNAGTVTLRSADPLNPPEIMFNYFDTGIGDYRADLQAMYEALELGCRAFKHQLLPVSEVLPGANVTSQEDIETYIKDTAWGHPSMRTCPIGSDDGPMAVLDSKFRVRGVDRLRVVDGSAFPRIPGTFPALAIYTVAEKAADVIWSEINIPIEHTR
ncbi:GMC oxidoreductase-domain-containing protein [Aspergillus pseudonomiae]|nr:GMC oxidoreductase-domain-containing protein [Aspergillus pseudonomiae]